MDTITAKAKTARQRHFRRKARNSTHTPTTHAAAIADTIIRERGIKYRVDGVSKLGAVVFTVIVTGVVVEEVKLTVAGLKLQLLSGGKFKHMDGESVAEPVRPFCSVNVSTVDPDWPGLATFSVIGLAVIVNVGGGTTVSVIVPEDGM